MEGDTLEKLMQGLGYAIDLSLKEHVGELGFALVAFHRGRPEAAVYISNTDKADMIPALKEAAKRLETENFIPMGDHETMH